MKPKIYILLYCIVYLQQTNASWKINSNKLDASVIAELSIQEQESLEFIDISKKNVTFIVPTIFEKLPKIVRLNMNHNEYFDFPKNKPFIISATIDNYKCTNCAITAINKYTFAKVPSLSTLELSDNKINYVDADAFVKNPKLYSLNLQYNKLTHFNEKGFLNDVRNLGYLMLNGNNEFNFLNDLPLTEKSDVLRIFECDKCAIQEICNTVLKVYPKLIRLKASNNAIKTIDENCMSDNNLISFDVSANPLKSITVTGKKLRNFACNNCSFEIIDDKTFYNVPALETLELKHNRIVNISRSVFKRNTHLNKAEFDGNMLTRFPHKIIDDVGSLKILCIDENPLQPSYENTILMNKYRIRDFRKGCSSEFPFENLLPNITSKTGKVLTRNSEKKYRSVSPSSLDLSNTDIAYIVPDYFKEENHVEFLNLSRNPQLLLPKEQAFLEHKNLLELDLSYCGIEEIHKSTFSKLPNLIKIDLTGNKIKFIEDNSFNENTNLQEIILDSNKLEYISSKVVDKVPELTRLSMNNNTDFEIEKGYIFLYHETLQEFYCDKCSIKYLSNATLSRMLNLRKLVLSNNGIEEIDTGAFLANKHLNYINLDGNDLVKIRVESFEHLTELRELCLDQNNEFDYSYNEQNIALKEFYEKKNLRSSKCTGHDDELFELLLPSRTTIKETTLKVETTHSIKTQRYIEQGDAIDYHASFDVGTEATTKQKEVTRATPKSIIQRAGFSFNDDNSSANQTEFHKFSFILSTLALLLLTFSIYS